MNHPKIKVEKGVFDKLVEKLSFLLIGACVVVIANYYNQLPEKLPVYFNWPSKDIDGLGAKELLWIGLTRFYIDNG